MFKHVKPKNQVKGLRPEGEARKISVPETLWPQCSPENLSSEKFAGDNIDGLLS